MARRRRSRSIGSDASSRFGRSDAGSAGGAAAAGAADGDAAAGAARDVAVRLLARAPRSIVEIETQLARRRFAPAAIAATVLALRELRYLDDGALARRRAEELIVRRGQGRLRVAYELTRRGVAESVVGEAIAAVMEGRRDAEIARLALCRKFGHDPHDALKDASVRARAYRFLVGRGHPPEAVAEVLGDDDSR